MIWGDVCTPCVCVCDRFILFLVNLPLLVKYIYICGLNKYVGDRLAYVGDRT